MSDLIDRLHEVPQLYLEGHTPRLGYVVRRCYQPGTELRTYTDGRHARAVIERFNRMAARRHARAVAPSILDCCDACDALLTARELANEAASRRQWRQLLCFDCIDSYQADAIARRTPTGGEA